MNLVNTLSPLQWLLLAAIPPAIVALYFLKLRRRPVEVPSTYLWSRAIEDLRVNSLWQRLRQSLLLFLQLLVVALAMAACLRPGWRGAQLSGNRLIFLVDTSASMSATDIPPSRLGAAKRRVLEMIEQMKSGDVAMLITFSDVARVEQSFTDNRSVLRQRVERIQPTVRRSDLGEALRAAAGLANPGRSSQDARDVQVAEPLPATVYILSDGGFASVPDFSLGHLTPVYIAMGSRSPRNVGIVAFSVERNPDRPGETVAFARLENSGREDAALEATLHLDDDADVADASRVTVPARGEAGVRFRLGPIEEGVVRIQLQHQDDLSLDNSAYAALGTPRRARVLCVTPHNDALRLALTTDEAAKAADVTLGTPEQLESKQYRDLAASGAYDLIIYDQCVPKEMPQANTLFVGRVPPHPGWSQGARKPLPMIIDTDRTHPLTELVEMGALKVIYDGASIKGPEGASVLFDSNIGPLLVVGHRDGFEDAALGFEIVGKDDKGETIAKTDWPNRRSFPIFIMNTLRYLGGVRGALAVAATPPGAPVTLRSRYPVDRIQVRAPSGAASEVLAEGQNTFVYSKTEELGVYRVYEGGGPEVAQRFAVNLCDSRESDLTPRPEIQLGYETVAGRPGAEPARKELWKWLLLAGLVVLAFEWYVYHRRVYL